MRPLAWPTPVLPLDGSGAGSTVPFRTDTEAEKEAAPLDGTSPSPVFLKLESLQRTSSFKMRGAANRLAKLSPEERARGVVAASSGNHARAVAEASRLLGVQATVCVPDWIDPLKLRAIRAARARVVLAGPAYDDAEARAAALADDEGLTPVHPFDDLDVIEGQGTVGVELLDQLPAVEEVVVPLSGGGLVAGVGLAVRERDVRVVAVSAERASVMHRSLLEGRPVDLPEEKTIASALSGGIGMANRFSFELVREVVDEHIVVSEDAVRDAVARAFREHRLVVEGGGAVGLAALWSGYEPRGLAAVVVSGGNLDPALLTELAGSPRRRSPTERQGGAKH